jgi:hypothetical protein
MSARTRPATISLTDRSGEGRPLVSVVIPCLNHGHYLPDALDSVRTQVYPHVEIVVVDDGSDDPLTRELMEELEEEDGLIVVRHDTNAGVAAALNSGVERASGRYVLPLDSDNRLLPSAIESLVADLNAAPLQVGFIYPTLQFFGNRTDRFVAPPYNLFTLLQGNYCDMSSLIDRRVFDTGVRYQGGLFREDWHLWLELAKRGVWGAPASAMTLLHRRRGFTRSDLVTLVKEGLEVNAGTRERHPELFSPAQYAAVKSDWLPALTVVALAALDGLPAGEALHRRAELQRCIDAQILVPAAELPAPADGPNLRAMPLRATPGETLRDGLELAKGRFVLVTEGTGADLLDDRGFVEKLLRVFKCNAGLQFVAFADAGGGHVGWQLLGDADVGDRATHAVAWAVDRLPVGREPLALERGGFVAALCAALPDAAAGQWRHLPRGEGAQPRAPTSVVLDPPRRDQTVTRPLARRLAGNPLLPGLCPEELGKRWASTWVPPQAAPVFRHVHEGSGLRAVTLSEMPPPGARLERRLGTLKERPLPGTQRLEMSAGGMDPAVGFIVSPHDAAPRRGARTLGFAEVAALPMLIPLAEVVVRETGQRTLASGRQDPLFVGADARTLLGWIEPSPLHPLSPGGAERWTAIDPDERPDDLLGVVRAVHSSSRRHQYGVGAVPDGTVVGELGSLHRTPREGSIPVWVDGDRALFVEGQAPARPHASPALAARWALSPLTWRDIAPAPRLAATAVHRVGTAATRLVSAQWRSASGVAHDDPPAGYLYREGGLGRLPLYAATHPVTGDQLLTPWPEEATKLGYGRAVLLGHLSARAPLTGKPLNAWLRSVPLPWAWRFGRPAERLRAALMEGPSER